LCFRDESAGDVDGVAGFSRGECNGYILSRNNNYFWRTFILTGGQVFGVECVLREEKSAEYERVDETKVSVVSCSRSSFEKGT
jgi:hypothetical protein